MYSIFNQFNQQDFEPRCRIAISDFGTFDSPKSVRRMCPATRVRGPLPCVHQNKPFGSIGSWGCWSWDAFCDPQKHHSIIKSCTDRERRIVSYSTLLTIFFPECMCNILNLCAFALLAFWPGTFQPSESRRQFSGFRSRYKIPWQRWG